jgi:hypothetical protein
VFLNGAQQQSSLAILLLLFLREDSNIDCMSVEKAFVDLQDEEYIEDWEPDQSRWQEWLIPSYLASLGLDDTGQGNEYRKDKWPSIATNSNKINTVPEFTFPIFVMNNPSRPDRREHMERLLPDLGFTNFSFPPGIAAKDLDIPSLLASGSVHPDAVARISDCPYKGPSAVAPYLANAAAHAAAIRACAAHGDTLCGVFEDDLVAPSGSAAARTHIAAVLSELPADADLLYLEV